MPPEELPELNLLRPWREPITTRRFLRDAAGSLAVHALIFFGLLVIPDVSVVNTAPLITTDLNHSVTLVLPRFFEPTQKDPNQGKVTRSLDVRSAQEGSPARRPRFRPPVPVPGPPAPPPSAAPVIDAPKIEIAAQGPVPSFGTGTPSLPPPPSNTKPKMVIENVTGPSPRPNPNPNVRLDAPKPSLEEMARAATRSPGGGGLVVGDVGEAVPGIPGSSQTPLQCQTCSTLQLLSDPEKVDFKPYLIQVLALVKRNWMAVIPESARMGRRGVVLIQFIVDRQGGVPKLVIASPSGTEALDRAAVAGVSASYPFPPLPAQYKGDQIRLQLAFAYNTAPR